MESIYPRSIKNSLQWQESHCGKKSSQRKRRTVDDRGLWSETKANGILLLFHCIQTLGVFYGYDSD